MQITIGATADARAEASAASTIIGVVHAGPPEIDLALIDAGKVRSSGLIGQSHPRARIDEIEFAQLYDYHFADSAAYARTGHWWVRRVEGLYFPRVSLGDFQRMSEAGTFCSRGVAAAPSC